LCCVARHPLYGFRELHGIQQARRSSAALDPLAHLFLEPAPALFVRAPLVDPSLELRPSGDQGLMREVHESLAAWLLVRLVAIDSDQAMRDKVLQHAR
jgi:hypothetical protein